LIFNRRCPRTRREKLSGITILENVGRSTSAWIASSLRSSQ
jgi:hypothetical protein